MAIDLAYRNPKAVSNSPSTCMQRRGLTARTDHRDYRREHVHVSPTAHPNRDALARPVLLPLPPKVGIVSQGKKKTGV